MHKTYISAAASVFSRLILHISQFLWRDEREIVNWFYSRGSACKIILMRFWPCVVPDVVDPLESMLPPELSILRDSSPHPREGTTSRRSGLPFPFPPPASDGLPYLPLPSALDDRPWEHGEPEEHPSVLGVGVSVQCEDTRMVVSIDKESLQVSGRQGFICHGSWKHLHSYNSGLFYMV